MAEYRELDSQSGIAPELRLNNVREYRSFGRTTVTRRVSADSWNAVVDGKDRCVCHVPS